MINRYVPRVSSLIVLLVPQLATLPTAATSMDTLPDGYPSQEQAAAAPNSFRVHAIVSSQHNADTLTTQGSLMPAYISSKALHQDTWSKHFTATALSKKEDDSPENEPAILECPSELVDPGTNPAEIKILINEIQIIGSTVFQIEDFDTITQCYEGKELTAEQLRDVADQITQIYLNNDYITSRAIPVEFDAIGEEGIATIQIIEGSLDDEDINIDGLRRLNPDYVRDRISLGTGTPLNVQALEEQLILLRIDPLIRNIEARIQPTGEQGQSRLVVIATENDPFEVTFGIDNYSPPSVGSERLGIGFRHRNLVGIGDDLSLSFFKTTTTGSQVLDAIYRIPVNAMDGTLQFRVTPSWTEITNSDASVLGIEGNNQLYSVTFRQPIIRKPDEDLALSLGFAYQDGQTFVFNDIPTALTIGPDSNGVSRTSVIQFGQEYVNRDPGGAWGVRSQFNFGVGLLDATINEDPIPDSRFFSWQGQLQRVQRIDSTHLLIAQLGLQLTPDTLLPSQKFVIGGGQLTRGYRQNVRTGDNGFRFSIEDRITLESDESGFPTIQLVPFFDAGMTWDTANNPNPQPDQRFIASVGAGFIFSDFMDVQGLGLRFGYGIPLVDLDDRGNNLQDDGFYFEFNYQQ